jgi:hypothetical protein
MQWWTPEAPRLSLVFVFCSSLMSRPCYSPFSSFFNVANYNSRLHTFFTSTLTMDLVVLHFSELCFQLLFFWFDLQYLVS